MHFRNTVAETKCLSHGQSINNELHVSENASFCSRQPDPSLTQEGRMQAEVGGYWLFHTLVELERNNKTHQHSFPEAILTSPMIRALETTQALSKNFSSLPLVILPNLCEIGGLFNGPRVQEDLHSSTQENEHQGISEKTASFESTCRTTGVTSGDIHEKFHTQKLIHNISNKGWWFGERESYAEAISRAWTIARLLWIYAVSHPYGSLIIVTHGLFQDIILKTLLSSCGPAPVSSIPPTEDLFLSVPSFATRKATMWPVFSSKSPIETAASRSNDLCSDHAQFLCNNAGISLIELFAVFPSPASSPNSNNSELSPLGSSFVFSPNSLPSQIELKLGILFWNQSFFLPEHLRFKSGHEVSSFSIF